ncbi:MAG: hypothetical protein KGQ48_14415 [Bradyrhizobium sp.]|nr:hypothetical protein [Bradyrhizobium sp.]
MKVAVCSRGDSGIERIGTRWSGFMSYVFAIIPQTYIGGLFVVQDKHDPAEFVDLATPHLPTKLLAELRKVYEDLGDLEGACVFTNPQTQWLIVVFQKEPREIRSVGLHEIVHLADRLTVGGESRALFIEHVYMAFADHLEARLASLK